MLKEKQLGQDQEQVNGRVGISTPTCHLRALSLLHFIFSPI